MIQVLQDWTGPTVSQVCQVPEVHLEKRAGLYLDRKEMRGIRAFRGLRGHLSVSTLQRTCTSKEIRALKDLKVSVEFRECRVSIPLQGLKERRGFWDFLDQGDMLALLGFLERKDSRVFKEVLVSLV